MSRRRYAILVAFMSAAPVAAQGADGMEDVVVRARPGAPAPPLGPAGYYRRHCFDAARLTGAPTAPEDDPDWTPLGDETRRRLGIADDAVPAYGLRDDTRGHTLLLKVERLRSAGNRGTIEERCTLVVIGGRGHADLPDEIGAIWRAGGTQRDLGGLEAPGWRRWHWSGMPARGSQAWRALLRGRDSESAALRVVDSRFYGEHDHIMGDLRTRAGGRPVSVLGFVRVRRPDRIRANEKGGPEGPPSLATRSGADQKSR